MAGVVSPHPHAYPWHDGHTDHHQPKSLAAIRGSASLRKDEPANPQAAGVGASDYGRFAAPYGHVLGPQAPSNLKHYPYETKSADIEGLINRHGFKTYYAGGAYGTPDLARRNYNTGHLMVYDPRPGGGGDFHDHQYTDAWRKIHELAHALTYPEVNSIYGEGRRIGKLGTHRSLHEAQRAVHWEWLAVHKQRELGEQMGVHVPDETFHKELNTVMHDAVHRAVTGKFTEPASEGFTPHPHKVPLSVAHDILREEADKRGLKKGWPNTAPSIGAVKPATEGKSKSFGGGAPSPWMPPSSAESASFKATVAAIPPKPAPGVPSGAATSPQTPKALAAAPGGVETKPSGPKALASPKSKGLIPKIGGAIKTVVGKLGGGAAPAVTAGPTPYQAPSTAEMQGFKNVINSIPGRVQKAEPMNPLSSPKAAGVAPAVDAQSGLHNTVKGFLGALQAHPKGSTQWHSVVQAHSNHAPLLGALHALPNNAGSGIIKLMSSQNNSVGNAGLGAGAKVVAKSEAPVILSEQGNPMADEKTYTPAEAAEVLKKAAADKIKQLEGQLQVLRKREMGKAMIPPHAHNTGLTVSAGAEDVPPGKKGFGKEALEAGEKEETTGPGEETSMAKEELCKDCGKMHKADDCGMTKSDKTTHSFKAAGKFGTEEGRRCVTCGEGIMHVNHDAKTVPEKHKAKIDAQDAKMPKEMQGVMSPNKKAELVDAKGNRSTNSERSDSAMPHGQSGDPVEAPGSGGKIRNGKSLANLRKDAMEGKKTKKGTKPAPKPPVVMHGVSPDSEHKAELDKALAPPTAKPPGGANMGTAVPTSTPKTPKMAAGAGTMGKAALSPGMAGQMQGGGATQLTHPSSTGRANALAGAQAGAFQPSGPVHSGLELATPAKPGSASPSPGLASPKAAGVAPAGKPGIFGRLSGRK